MASCFRIVDMTKTVVNKYTSLELLTEKTNIGNQLVQQLQQLLPSK